MNCKKLLATLIVLNMLGLYSGVTLAAEAAVFESITNSEISESNEVFSESDIAATPSEQNNLMQTVSYGPETTKFETLPKIKNVSSNMVSITNDKIVIPSGDVFKVAFMQDFSTKNLNVGEKIIFNLPGGLYTEEGRMLLPAGTQFVSVVKSVDSPKMFNKNAKAMLEFSGILVPNSAACAMGACTYGKYNALQRSGWATFTKPAAWTVGMFGVGAGIGAACGAAASAATIGCLAIGMPVGAGVGLAIGLITPGLHYKAKAGKEIPIMLTQDMVLVQTK